MEIGIYTWIVFNVAIVAILIFDLCVIHRKSHTIEYKEAFLWSGIWIALALLFCLFLYFRMGTEPALNFLAGYLVEKALSIDNLFVFLLIFTYFSVPSEYIHKVLFWGVIGALVIRALFIFAGILLIQWFHWLIYVLGAFLILMGIKLAFKKETEIHPEHNPMLILLSKFMPITKTYEDGHFFVKKSGRYWATPLFAVLVVVETTDIIFALDSVPAILAITTDPFIVYTSNVFAILGLRSLYFALSGLMKACYYLHYGLAALLIFVGFKMLLSDYIHIPIFAALGVIAGIIALSVIASFLVSTKKI